MCSPVKGKQHKICTVVKFLNAVTADKVWGVGTDDKSFCWDWTVTHIFLLGHLDFPSADTTNSRTLSASTTNLLWRTKTNKQSVTVTELLWPAATCVFRTDLRHVDVSDWPSLPSAWCCTETLPSLLWPSSWRWGWWGCSVAASGPHLRPASADKMSKTQLHTHTHTRTPVSH